MLDTIVAYFSYMPSLHRTILLVGGLTLFSLFETARPLFDLTYNRTKHALPNIVFTLTTVIVNFSLAFVLLSCSVWATSHGFGLLSFLPEILWLKAIVGLMAMDLIGAYAVHWVEHKIPFMWKFHVIHHIDQHVDTTTANRHHPGESVFRLVFTSIAVLIIGAPIWLIFLYQTISLVLTQFNHANISMPQPLDKALQVLICTPNMHRVHHHYRQPYSDSNYGNIFSIWDRIFGTMSVVDNTKLTYGVDTHMDSIESNSIAKLMKIPFESYKATPKYDEAEQL